ncbi:hypothetical protein HPB51_008571 [Rhipicephalus microplus]|uniref:Uncharacterized protein n=1 Tax=Rhipicephalus microplus TaxID=6941 RepID=A0A9J6EFP4_RHIMP|nr:hypothetical protein HPB51_008571 [Rhipicephalus microplus]
MPSYGRSRSAATVSLQEARPLQGTLLLLATLPIGSQDLGGSCQVKPGVAANRDFGSVVLSQHGILSGGMSSSTGVSPKPSTQAVNEEERAAIMAQHCPFDTGVSNVDICRDLVKRFEVKDIACVQDFGGGTFEVTFVSEDAVQQFKAKQEIFVGKGVVRFQYRGARTMTMRIFGYPENCPDKHLMKGLQEYGKVLGIREESVPKFESISSGVRRVRMEMEKAVPNIMESNDRLIYIEYDGVVRSSFADDREDSLTAAGGSTQRERVLLCEAAPGGEKPEGAELEQAEASPHPPAAEPTPAPPADVL